MDNSDKSEAAGVGNASGAEHGSAEISSKGKGKAVDNAPQDVSMDEDEDDSDEDEETGAEDEAQPHEEDEEDEDNMEEIDLDNIVGRRTRGKKINFAKAAEEAKDELGDEDDDDEEDDDDFEEPDDAMQE